MQQSVNDIRFRPLHHLAIKITSDRVVSRYSSLSSQLNLNRE